MKGDLDMIEYDIGTGRFSIGAGAPLFKPAPGGGVVALGVDDFGAAISRLKEHRVKFLSESHEAPVCHLVTIADPDGNLLLILKRKAA